mgnify:CR=1 FL=1
MDKEKPKPVKDWSLEVIKSYLPHRYPFLFLDKVLECVPNDHILALKNVSANEEFFSGHFPHRAVMPGVLIIEAMAQAAAVLSFASAGRHPDEDSVIYFAGIEKARFRRPVVPGDQLLLKAALLRERQGVWKYETHAHVGEDLAAHAFLTCTLKSSL